MIAGGCTLPNRARFLLTPVVRSHCPEQWTRPKTVARNRLGPRDALPQLAMPYREAASGSGVFGNVSHVSQLKNQVR